MRIALLSLFLFLYSCESEIIKTSIENKRETETENFHLNDPIFYHGSTFGEYFQILVRTGRYNEIVNITSQRDRLKFGDSTLSSFYKKLEFSFPLKLKAYKKEKAITWLFYETNIMATRSTLQFPIIIENDSCKVCFELLSISNIIKNGEQ